MAHEDIVLDGHPFANERVAGDLAICTDKGVLLDLHESAHLGVIPDGAAIQVDMIEDLDALPDLHIGGDALGRVDNKIL
jgi:hypothetical protein